MKFRFGFVSNSSSTSFIVSTEKELKLCKDFNITIYSVDEILKQLTSARDKLVEVCKSVDTEKIPYFFFNNYGSVESTFNLNELECRIKQLEEIKGKYITAPIDRDWAFHNIRFESFETDL